MAPLGILGRYINGRAFKPKEWENQGLPIIRIQNLNDPLAAFNYSRGEYDARFKVRNGDLLIAWSASLGAFIWNGNDAWLNQHIFRVEPDLRICTKKFLLYAVQQAIRELYGKAHGSGMVHVTKPVFEGHKVPVPPLIEQRRIAATVEMLLNRVNLLQQRLETTSLVLKRFRQSVLAAACSGRLSAHWREQHSTGNGDNEELPTGWRSAAIGEVIENLKYGTSQKCTYEKYGVPVLRIPNIAEGVIDHSDLKYADLPARERQQLSLEVGDLLLIRSNGSVSLVGKTALVREEERGFAYAGYLIRLRPKRCEVLPEYLNLALASYEVRSQIELGARSTSGVNNINSEEVADLRFALPPLNEQAEIIVRSQALLAIADRIESRYKAAKTRIDGLSQSILARAFRGELVPTEAELAAREARAYESGEQLLQRIRQSEVLSDQASKSLRVMKKQRSR